MSKTRAELVELVVEAAQILEHSAYVIRGRKYDDADTYAHELEHIRYLTECLDALKAHDDEADKGDAS